MGEPRIGIIGGSGLYELEGLTEVRWRRVRTPFGDPSDAYCIGRLGAREVVFFAASRAGHRLLPIGAAIPRQHLRPEALGVEWVALDQRGRAACARDRAARPGHRGPVLRPHEAARPLFLRGGVRRPRGDGRSRLPRPRGRPLKTAVANRRTVHPRGTYLCIEGPQFSTKAESQIYRGWGVDVIGMTNVPEAKLAREAELCYATVALATDYDVWHEAEAAVTVEAVIATS